MRVRNFTKQQLCDAVFNAVSQAKTPPSRLEICTAIGRKKSPHIVVMIEHLVELGYFAKFEGVDDWDRPTVRYRVAKTGQPNCESFG